MTVIVGVDGSVGARAALDFAMDEAVRRQSALRVIAVVQLPAYGFAAMTGLVPPSPAVLVEDVSRMVPQHVDDIVAARESESSSPLESAACRSTLRLWQGSPGRSCAPRPATPTCWWSAGAAMAR